MNSGLRDEIKEIDRLQKYPELLTQSKALLDARSEQLGEIQLRVKAIQQAIDEKPGLFGRLKGLGKN